MKFCKYHGLGNGYFVLSPAEVGGQLTRKQTPLGHTLRFGRGGRPRRASRLR